MVRAPIIPLTHIFATATRPERIDTINQVYNSNPETKRISTTFSYTELVGKNQLIELNYNYSGNRNTSGKHTYNFGMATGNYDIPVMNLSNIFENTYQANRFSLNYRVQNTKMNFSVGSGLQLGDRSSHNLTKDSTLTQHYVNLSPTANFSYAFSKTRNLRFFYYGRTGQPSIDQLQPVVDNSNPLNIKVGNPDLKQQFTHSFRVLYNSYEATTGRIIFATVNASVLQNDIQNATTLLPNGGQMVKPVNLGGAYNVNAFFNYGHDLAGKHLKGSPRFLIGACVTPEADVLEPQIIKMERKVEAGAQFFQTQAAYDPKRFADFISMVQHVRVPILAGIVVLRSAAMGRYMNEKAAGIRVPETVIGEMESASDKAAKGVENAVRTIAEVRGLCQGVHIMTIGMEKRISDIIDAAGL